MTDESREKQGESHDNQGEAVPLNWACTNCGYRVEGELPKKCPDCGADREGFVTPGATPAPVPTLTLTVSPRTRRSL
jgi:rubrerythrin